MDSPNKSNIDINSKKLLLSERFNINNNKLTADDIYTVIEKLPDSPNLRSKATANKIFKELDVKGTGAIQAEELLSHIASPSYSISLEETQEFLSKLRQELIPKSEIIIQKLKSIRNKAYLSNDHEAQKDIDWIISNISTNIYEPDIEAIKNLSAIPKTQTDYIVKFSPMEEVFRKEGDLKAINNTRTINNFSKTFEGFYNTSTEEMVNPEFKKRRTERLATFVSPSLLNKINSQLANLKSFDFDIFELNKLAEKKTTYYIAYDIFSQKGYVNGGLPIKDEKLKNFITAIVDGYDRKNVYHNDLHAGDVVQTLFMMLEEGNLCHKLKLNDLDIFSVLLSGLCHDYKHTGQGNIYHINSKSTLALTYNDASVLENYHISETFKVMLEEDNNVMSEFSPEEFRIARRRIIDGILNTDMARHAKLLASVKAKTDGFNILKGENIDKLFTGDNVNANFENQQLLIGFFLHAADISSPAKDFNTCQNWMNRVYTEFFLQGDMEKKLGLNVSLMCDRNTTKINKSQCGFINFIIAPTFELVDHFIPELVEFNINVKNNLKRFEFLAKEDEKKEKAEFENFTLK